ncbi:hypothetical protein AALO_G00268770 [Alosa alosa]|uniref:Secreted protein n=1 Tax=Alosa alosa TaxID=278164 RepID=A0AAV6FRE4_9TELE|nr:hypothetical protein AALO_G00268770 [Alosa alosa]
MGGGGVHACGFCTLSFGFLWVSLGRPLGLNLGYIRGGRQQTPRTDTNLQQPDGTFISVGGRETTEQCTETVRQRLVDGLFLVLGTVWW